MRQAPSTDETRPGRAGHQLMIRLPTGLRDRIKIAADRSGRSLNAEVVATLIAAYPEPEVTFEEIVEGVLSLLAQPSGQNELASDADADREVLASLLERLRNEVERRRD